jgi:S1-C subfamily serine protease
MFMDANLLTNVQIQANKIPVSGDGIYITNLVKYGDAMEGGIKCGDIIRKINDIPVNSGSELQEQLSKFRPGDKVNVTYERNNSQKTVQVILKNNAGNYDIVKSATLLDNLGADLVTLDAKKAKEYGLNGGVIVRKINEGVINDQTRMRDGFIITKANGKTVKSVEDLSNIIGNSNEVTITGVYPGYSEPFEYPLVLNDSGE